MKGLRCHGFDWLKIPSQHLADGAGLLATEMSDLQLTLYKFAGRPLYVLVTSLVGRERGTREQKMNGGIGWEEGGFIIPVEIAILNRTSG